MTLKNLESITHRHVHRAGRSAAVNIHVRDLTQLLNSLDPSPFWDRDLDPIAAEFIEEASHSANSRTAFSKRGR